MAIYQINTTNKNFSYILQKNPLTGLQCRNNKNGMFFYWFSNNDLSFNIYFKDKSEEISYKKNEYDSGNEYLSSSQYNNARCLVDCIQELLHTAREKDSMLDLPGENNQFVINLIQTEYKTLDIFKRYYNEEQEGVLIQSEELIKNNYKVTISTSKRTLRELLNIVNLFAIFAVLNSEDDFYVTEELVQKYIKLANFVDAPYFIKYLIKIRMIRSINKFNNLLDSLNKSTKLKLDFKFGDTHQMRINWIKEKIKCDRPIIDIGCGIDSRYLRFLAPVLQSKNLVYYAIDVDQEARDAVTRFLDLKDITNVQIFDSIESLTEYLKENNQLDIDYDIICTEVIEHCEFKEARDLTYHVLENYKFNQFVITTPNNDFNKFYDLTEVFRHDDHKWEMKEEEFKNSIENLVAITNDQFSKNFTTKFEPIGDLVNDIPVTSGVIIK